jgi:hypothetical protein
VIENDMYMRNVSGSADINQDTAANESKKRRIQMEILILESDLRKLSNEKNGADNDVRKMTHDEERIRVELDKKRVYLAKVAQETRSKEEELRVLRKKLNLS